MKKKYTKDEFLAKWLNGDLNKEELKAFQAEEDFETFKAIAELSKGLEPPSLNRTKVLREIEQQTTSVAKLRMLRRKWMTYAAAAMVLLAFGIFFLLQNSMVTISAPVATTHSLILPDGSEVVLNAASTITYNKEEYSEKRYLQLNGEAFFKVKKGSQFLVETTNGKIQVLGTSFNVFARKKRLDVSCYSGLVGVFFQDASKMEQVAQNNKIIAQNGEIVERIAIKQQVSPEWTRGNSRFYNVELVEVVEEIERQYNVTIIYPSSLNVIKGYNGGFPHDDLRGALQIIFGAFGYQFEIKGKEVRVFK